MSEFHDETYIRQLVAAGEKRDISAAEDIYNEGGVKLLAAGSRINKATYEKLVRNKLLKPIDASLGVHNGIDSANLVRQLKQLVGQRFVPRFIGRAFRDAALPERIFRQVHINGPLSVKLTVTQEQAPEKFHHLLSVALAALYTGVCEKLEPLSLIELVTAGLFHDLGEMHLDPAIHNRGTPLTPELRRQVFSHPLIIQLILNEFPEYHANISEAVLEHHERLDGSGYPRGIKGDGISLHGRILAVAELVVVLLEGAGDIPDWDYLATSLKLNTGKYDERLIRHWVVLLRHQQHDTPATLEEQLLAARQLWQSLAELLAMLPMPQSDTAPKAGAQAFVLEHVQSLEHLISRAGFTAQQAPELLASLGEDQRGLSELHSIAVESRYRLLELVREVERRWPEYNSEEGCDTALKHWLDSVQAQLAE